MQTTTAIMQIPDKSRPEPKLTPPDALTSPLGHQPMWIPPSREDSSIIELARKSFESGDFAENSFLCHPARTSAYATSVTLGRSVMRRSAAVICGLCRDVGQGLALRLRHIAKLGSMFKRHQIVIFENDSVDDTRRILTDWRDANDGFHLLIDDMNVPRFPRTRMRERATHMADCRNRYWTFVRNHFSDYDFVVVLDTDLEGGWSYDGIATTFSYQDWDFVGSNGIYLRGNGDDVDWVQYDSWAFRSVGRWEPHADEEVNTLKFDRGNPMIPVWSCFGGLGIYRTPCVLDAEYSGIDCEHVCLHRALYERGRTRLFLNPSQIVLYALGECGS